LSASVDNAKCGGQVDLVGNKLILTAVLVDLRLTITKTLSIYVPNCLVESQQISHIITPKLTLDTNPNQGPNSQTIL